MKWRIRFHHGLGDCANFVRILPLWKNAGHEIAVQCEANKRPLFEAAGVEIIPAGEKVDAVHGWPECPPPGDPRNGGDYSGNKTAWNLASPEMPKLIPGKGCCPDIRDLWQLAMNESRPDPMRFTNDTAMTGIAELFEPLPKPIVLIHSRGNTRANEKNLDTRTEQELYQELYGRFDGTQILIDWDNRISTMPHWRCRTMRELSGRNWDLPHLVAAMLNSSLLIGVDSGPLHLANLLNVPAVGVWRGSPPCYFALPSDRHFHLASPTFHRWNVSRRHAYLTSETGGNPTGAEIATAAVDMIEYHGNARDVILDRMFKMCRGKRGALFPVVDRDRTFDKALRTAAEASYSADRAQRIVETGTIRSEEDWGGAGYSTYLFSWWLQQYEPSGTLNSIDNNGEHVRFARKICEPFPQTTIHEADSVAWLKADEKPIDLLYLDSQDTTEPGFDDHAVAEFRAAENRTNLVLIDDTVWQAGRWKGKGGKLVPIMLAEGWQIIEAGYQVLMSRQNASGSDSSGGR